MGCSDELLLLKFTTARLLLYLDYSPLKQHLYPNLVTHLPFLIAIRLLCHLSVNDDHGAISSVLEVPLHCLPRQLVHLQLILFLESDSVDYC